MSRKLATALVFLSLHSSSQSKPSAVEELRNLRQQAHAARESGDSRARLQAVLEVQELLNDAPDAVEAAAHAYVQAADPQRALDSLALFAELGQVDDDLLQGTDRSFAMLKNRPQYAVVLKRFAENKTPVSRSKTVLTLADPGILAEDIDYDTKSKTFLITSVREKKILRVTFAGEVSDFAQSPSHWPMLAIKVDPARSRVWTTEVAMDGFTAVPRSDWGRSAVLCFDLRTGVLLRRIEGPSHTALGDMVLTKRGDPIVSDGTGGGIYQVVGDHLQLVNGRDFISPQTSALHPDGQQVFVPDYARGIGLLDLKSKQVVWLNRGNGKNGRIRKRIALNGTDGLYFYRGSLILTQNGTSPERVICLQLDKTLMKIVGEQIIERATPTLGDPTHGVVVGDSFYYIANSGWNNLDEHGDPKSGARLSPARIMRFALR